jgi:hypothetical protein
MQRRQVAALASMPDDKIDYSDIPPLKDRFWKRAVRKPVLPSGDNGNSRFGWTPM